MTMPNIHELDRPLRMGDQKQIEVMKALDAGMKPCTGRLPSGKLCGNLYEPQEDIADYEAGLCDACAYKAYLRMMETVKKNPLPPATREGTNMSETCPRCGAKDPTPEDKIAWILTCPICGQRGCIECIMPFGNHCRCVKCEASREVDK